MAIKIVNIPNINCGHCTSIIERELIDLESVHSVKAEIKSKQVTVEWEDSLLSWDQIADLLREIGYPPKSEF